MSFLSKFLMKCVTFLQTCAMEDRVYDKCWHVPWRARKTYTNSGLYSRFLKKAFSVSLILLILSTQLSLILGEDEVNADTDADGRKESAVEEFDECNTTERTYPFPKGPFNKSIIIGYLTQILGNEMDKIGLKISGAITASVEKVNRERILPDNYTLQFVVSIFLFVFLSLSGIFLCIIDI